MSKLDNNYRFQIYIVGINQINENLATLMHSEIFPLYQTIRFMFIYELHQMPQLNSLIQYFDN